MREKLLNTSGSDLDTES
jgi:hypothetical protein